MSGKIGTVLGLTLVILLASFDLALGKAKDKQIPLLTEILNQYRASNALELKTNRTIRSELLNQEQQQEGTLYISGNKIRWEFVKPEKTILIFDGKYFWNVQTPPEEFGGPTQVLKTKLNKTSRSQLVLTSVLGKEPLSKFYKFVETKTNSADELEYFMTPLKKDQALAKEVRITISKAKKLVTRVTYIDDLGNATVVDMKKTEFKSEVRHSLFSYKPGPKDRVNEL